MRRIKFKAVRVIGKLRVSAFAKGYYYLDYPKGAIVRAREGTLGIAVFGRRSEAVKFCRVKFGNNSFEIVRVLPIGRGRNVKKVSRSQSAYMLDIFYGAVQNTQLYSDSFTSMLPPPGTIFYPAVEVIE